jgi:glycosyltransferase involved in cell wall biosynthesis
MKKIAFLYLWNPTQHLGGASLEILDLKKTLEERKFKVDLHYILPYPLFGIRNYIKKISSTIRLFTYTKNLKNYDFVVSFYPCKTLRSIKTIRFFQGNDFRSLINNPNATSLYRFFKFILDIISLNGHSIIFCVSSQTKIDLKRIYRTKTRIEVLHPGSISNKFVPPKNKLAVKNDLKFKLVPTILSVGTLNKAKGMHRILNISRKLKKYQFVIIGQGNLKKDILKNKIGNLRLIEEVPHSQIHKYYQASDLYLSLSRNEAFPMVIREAIKCGLPIISLNVGDSSFIVENGFNGFILPKNVNDKIIIKKINKIFNSKQLLNKLSTGSVKMAKKISWDEEIKKFINTLNEI